jgi:phosphohistidine phosphatase
MILYIVRHAIAVAHGTAGVAEDDRPLTEEGIRKMKKAAIGMRNLGITPEFILSSPLPRARETAEIVQQISAKKASLVLVEALAPGGSRAEVYRKIREHSEAPSIMIVGHQPSLGEIAGEIAWGSTEHYIEMKKGGACAIEIEEGHEVPRGTLIWLMTPALLRSAAG